LFSGIETIITFDVGGRRISVDGDRYEGRRDQQLLRDGGVFDLRRQPGGRYQLYRTPVNFVKKQINLIGTLLSRGVIDADCIAGLAYCIVFPSSSSDRSYD